MNDGDDAEGTSRRRTALLLAGAGSLCCVGFAGLLGTAAIGGSAAGGAALIGGGSPVEAAVSIVTVGVSLLVLGAALRWRRGSG